MEQLKDTVIQMSRSKKTKIIYFNMRYLNNTINGIVR